MMKKLISLLLILTLLLSSCSLPDPPAAPTAPAVTEPAPTESPVTEPPATEPPTMAQLSQNALVVTYLDVGQADCAILACGGEFAIIDGGNTADGPKVVEYLTEQGVENLSLVVGTHPHEDHIGGLADVLRAFPANTLWTSRYPYDNDVTYAFRHAAKDRELELQIPKVGDVFSLGDATITMLGPTHMYYENVNDLSLVLMVEYGNTRFLFTGDMTRDAEIPLLDSGADVKADVLKVGHHGSYTSTSYRFLREVAPTYAVIPVGAANDYGHPHDEPMSRLKDAEVIIYRTDKMYTITAVSDGENITFSWQNPYAKPWTPET